jgi:tetratricopeptide (TPR) repeat protein
MLYYLLRCKQLNISTLINFRDNVLEGYFSYLIVIYKKICTDTLVTYLEEIIEDTIDSIRIRKILGKVLLLSGKFKNTEYEKILMGYMQDGIKYIYYVYNKNIILTERIYDVRNEEDAMFLYMSQAEKMKNRNKVEYIRYLKKALDIYPNMAKGIEVITQKIEEDMRKQESLLNNKEETKEKIKKLIDSGNLLRAHKLIHEYERINKNDIQIFSMKAVVAIMEERLNEAEAIINEGLSIDDKDLDLLYNLKYIYEYQGEIKKAEALQVKIEASK